MKPRLAIIGAGLSGLVLGHALAPQADVTIFEKARGVGGRLATRRAGDFAFDHGAQYFAARTPAFQAYLAPFIKQGLVAPWQGHVMQFTKGRAPQRLYWREEHLVAVPGMNSLCKHLANGLNIITETEVQPPTRTAIANPEGLTASTTHLRQYKETEPFSHREKGSGGWQLRSTKEQDLGHFDWLIVTAPPAQATRLLGAVLPAAAPLHEAQFHGCFALMVGLSHPWPHEWTGGAIHKSPLKWVSVNSTKPGRDTSTTALVAHSHKTWTKRNIDAPLDEVRHTLLHELSEIISLDLTAAPHIDLHRWRYATMAGTPQKGFYLDATNKAASTGDWCYASRVEEVWRAATELAAALSVHLENR